MVNQFFLFFFIFVIALLGILLNKRKDILIVLVCVELMLLSVGLMSISFSIYLDDFVGQILSIFILTVAAAESAVGLGILIQYYKVKGSISLIDLTILRG